MSLLVTCPHCGARLKLPSDSAGKTVECPECAESFTSPIVETPPPSSSPPQPELPKDDRSENGEAKPRRKKRGREVDDEGERDDEAKRVRRRRRYEEDYDEQTTRNGPNTALIVLIVVCGAFLVGCLTIGGCALWIVASRIKTNARVESGAPAAGPAAKINDLVKLHDSEWVVLGAEDLGKTAVSNNRFQKDAQTEGRFIRVHFRVTNRTKKEERLLINVPVIVDSQGREFKHIDGESFYIPNGAKTLSMEALPPDIGKEFYEVYEVSAGASELKLRVSPIEALGPKKLVDLGL